MAFCVYASQIFVWFEIISKGMQSKIRCVFQKHWIYEERSILMCMLHDWETWSFSWWSMWTSSIWCVTIKSNFYKSKRIESKVWNERPWGIAFLFRNGGGKESWWMTPTHQPNQIYLKEILKHFRMEECNPIGVAFNPKVKLQRNGNGNDESKEFPYQQAVGSLVYAMLCTWAISWSSKWQPTIALSTTVAEYMTNTQATKEATWITKLMMDLGYMEEKKVMVIWCDNQGAISLTKNPTHDARIKHIDVQHHFVQKRVENGEVWFEYCPTEHMVVDVLTKALSKERHHKLMNMFRLEIS